jgi:hypothetical protein
VTGDLGWALTFDYMRRYQRERHGMQTVVLDRGEDYSDLPAGYMAWTIGLDERWRKAHERFFAGRIDIDEFEDEIGRLLPARIEAGLA